MSVGTESAWELDRFGSLAVVLRERCPQLVQARHDLSVAAQVAGGMRRHYPYGVTQHRGLEEALADLATEIPGLVVRSVQGAGAALVVEETGTVIHPFRYAKNRQQRREQANMSPLSEVRRMLFVQDIPPMSEQLTLEQGQLSDEELVEFEAEVEDRRAAGRVGVRVAVLGYGSDVSGVWGIGWGEIEIRDPQTADVHWTMWVPLDSATANTQSGAGPLRLVDDISPAEASFDTGAPADFGFNLHMRPGAAAKEPGGPADEPVDPETDTGTDSDGSVR